MGNPAEELIIRSRHGALRDLLPVYTPWSIAAALGALAFVLLLGWVSGWHLPPVFLLLAALQWHPLYAMRPSMMTLSSAQAEQVEAAMVEEAHFSQSLIEGRWELGKDSSWQDADKVIELIRADGGVELHGPRKWLEAIRDYLEWVEDGGVSRGAAAAHPFQVGEPEVIPWHAKAPGVVLAAIMVPVFVYDLFTGQIWHWGISGQAIAQERYDTILLHMISHGSIMHIMMNVGALLAIAPGLVMRLGPAPRSWLRFLTLFLGSGLAGAALYLMIHPFGHTPMVGASGAIYGLVGLLVRLPNKGEELLSFRSRKVRRMGVAMIKENIFLFALLALIAWSSGSSGGLAWEAHLGGFLFGFFVGPRFLPRPSAPVQA